MSENLSPVKAESASPIETAEDTKNKKKKKAIGAFIVEADPSQKSDSFWSRAKSTRKELKPSSPSPEQSSETGTLSESEKTEAVKQLAAARRLELTDSEVGSSETPAETEAALAYLSAVEADGEIESVESVLDSENLKNLSLDVTSNENVIDTDQPSEGEILLDNEPVHEQPPVVVDAGNGNSPPRNPNFNQAEPEQPDEPVGPFGTFGSSAGMVMAPVVGNTIPLNIARQNERRAQTDGLIVGAIVGYLVGRRRGRIKTEKKLLPVQKKLEKQVKSLQSELITREYQVRQKVREQLIVAPAGKETNKLSAPNQESRQRAKLTPTSTERIGHVLVAASSNAEKAATVRVNKPPKLESADAKKRAESMDRSELLAISQTIAVEGTSLRQIYESQLISEKGLRRLVAEHLRGGNIGRALKRELVERQIDFERDPILRDKSNKNSADNAGKAALAGMLSKAGVSETKQDEIIKTNRQKEAAIAKSVQKTGPQTLIDVSLAALIGLLLLIILSLIFRG